MYFRSICKRPAREPSSASLVIWISRSPAWFFLVQFIVHWHLHDMVDIKGTNPRMLCLRYQSHASSGWLWRSKYQNTFCHIRMAINWSPNIHPTSHPPYILVGVHAAMKHCQALGSILWRIWGWPCQLVRTSVSLPSKTRKVVIRWCRVALVLGGLSMFRLFIGHSYPLGSGEQSWTLSVFPRFQYTSVDWLVSWSSIHDPIASRN